MPYTSVSISGYNSSPPTDDGSNVAANQITWAGIKTKLGDPINTAIPSMDDNMASVSGSLDSDITAVEAVIASIDTDVEAEAGVLTAPSGTELFFVQTNAPTGWTKITTHNNKAIRLIAGTVSSGGSTAFTSVLTSRTITSSNMPSHSHSVADSGGSITLDRTSWTNSLSTNSDQMTSGGNSRWKSADSGNQTFSATITFSGTTGSAGSGTAMGFAVQYVDIILASKD